MYGERVESLLDKVSPKMFEYVMYMPRRSATYNHYRAYPTLGVTSRVDVYHHLYIDFDNHNVLENVLRLHEILCELEMPNVLLRTKKGYHIRVYFPFQWKDVTTILSKIKPMIDTKWLNLQRKRGLIIIRIAGKYPRNDIYVLSKCFKAEQVFSKYAKLVHLSLQVVNTLFYMTPWEKINLYFEKIVREGRRVCLK